MPGRNHHNDPKLRHRITIRLLQSDCLRFGFALLFQTVVGPAQPLSKVGNLVVLCLKLRRLSLQFGFNFRKLCLQTPDFGDLSLLFWGVIRNGRFRR